MPGSCKRDCFHPDQERVVIQQQALPKRSRIPGSNVLVTGEPRQVLLEEQLVRYMLFRVKNLRRMKMSIASAHGLRVVVPQSLAVTDVEGFLQSKAAWILRHLQKQEALHQDLQQMQFRHDGQFLFLGTMHPIRVRPVEGSNMRVTIVDDEVIVEAPDSPGGNVGEDRIKFALGVLFARHARVVMEPLVQSTAAVMNLKHGALAFRPHKSRWGSCSAKGNLSFNQFILMAPMNVVHYVVIHELAHLVEHNHSPRFWAVVEKYCEHSDESRRWLRKHGHVLEFYYQHINVRMKRTRGRG
jgi:predicted metal-dependent hydrolase